MATKDEKRAPDREGESDVTPPAGWFKGKRKLGQDLEYVNRELYRRNLELAQSNKTLGLLQAIDTLVLGPDEPLGPLCTGLAEEIVRALDLPYVAILGYPAPGHDLEVYGWAANDEISHDAALMLSRVKPKGNLGWYKREDKLKFVSIATMPSKKIAEYCGCTEEQVEIARKTSDLSSVCLVKLSARQRLVGVMMMGFSEPGKAELSEFEDGIFRRLSEAIGIAIDHKLLLTENKRVLAQLESSNRKLRLMDRTKDDFISMASHQLRTPLTSVKGYVSMVLDNDAGKITPTQRKLLTQAFISSQRMTYLISDLLNVSRLRTGKFIIEPSPVNLAKVIEEEIDQLQETAKGRSLELTYKRPDEFPDLMLDETKIRQVIMNFVDNAIYYTPAGGHITVNLDQKPESIELTVVDDGMGVPRREQHHLFTKFYRARNAKKARPDGTGLGLFMAKKVVVAQGGAIIFKSQEGRGSTFGFTFPKARILTPADPTATTPETARA